MIEHKSRSHARLSASGAHIWMTCLPSAILSNGLERRPSKYADEGTAAHEVAERMLRDKGVAGPAEADPAADTMRKWVQPFVDYCEALAKSAPIVGVEQRVSLAGLWEGNPPEEMFGTADFFAVTPDRTLHVVDLKYGQHVPVHVEDNPQLKYYALGVVLGLKDLAMIEQVRITVAQPRCPHPDGPIRSWDMPLVDLLLWGEALRTIVERIQEWERQGKRFGTGDTWLVEGDHCRWCAANGKTCPAKHHAKVAQAQKDFA